MRRCMYCTCTIQTSALKRGEMRGNSRKCGAISRKCVETRICLFNYFCKAFLAWLAAVAWARLSLDLFHVQLGFAFLNATRNSRKQMSYAMEQFPGSFFWFQRTLWFVRFWLQKPDESNGFFWNWDRMIWAFFPLLSLNQQIWPVEFVFCRLIASRRPFLIE